MDTCAYENCRVRSRLNADGICTRCGASVEKVRERLASGRLPRMPSAQLTPGEKLRTTPIPRSGGGMPCAACDEAINEGHWAYPDFPDQNRQRGHDLHFHKLCEEIWQKEA
jgi:hypothetical protein